MEFDVLLTVKDFSRSEQWLNELPGWGGRLQGRGSSRQAQATVEKPRTAPDGVTAGLEDVLSCARICCPCVTDCAFLIAYW